MRTMRTITNREREALEKADLEKLQKTLDETKMNFSSSMDYRQKYIELLQEHIKLKERYNDIYAKWKKMFEGSISDGIEKTKLEQEIKQLKEKIASDKVRVNITFIDHRWNEKYSEIMTMTKDEYKTLLKGSMQARIAYVISHSENVAPKSRDSIGDVSVSLAE